jgi:hypothetical protein
VTYDTFWHTFTQYGNKKITGKEPKSKLLGLDERFHDPKKCKIKHVLNVPGPGNYPMIAKWPEKIRAKSKTENKKNWMDSVSKGFARSIYY